MRAGHRRREREVEDRPAGLERMRLVETSSSGTGRSRESEIGPRRGYRAPMRHADPREGGRSGRAALIARAAGARRRPCGRRSAASPSRCRRAASSRERVVAHLGPTNSGKTYAALRELADKGSGVYAGPLRMLAQEAHRRLGEWIGPENVGLVTGEERVNEHAPVICSTVEMAPLAGELLVLDEVQWADDTERGSAWTRLLLAGEYREILLLGALDALPLVERAFPEHELKVFERKLPLEFVGERTLRSLTPGTVVVAFSRRAVLALAGEVNRLHPGKRRRALRRDAAFVTARGDRALHLRCRRRLRRHRRSRARRQPPVRDAPLRGDDEVRRGGAARPPAVGARADRRASRSLRPRRARTRRRARRARMGNCRTRSSWSPALEPHVPLPGGHSAIARSTRRGFDRSSPTSASTIRCDLDAALVAWHRVALREWAFESWLAVESLQPLRLRLQAVQRRLAERGRQLSLADSWKLVNAPVDEDNLELLATLALAITGDRVARPQLSSSSTPRACAAPRSRMPSRPGERRASCAGSHCSTPGVGGVTIERAAALEEAAAERVVARLRVEVESPTLGRCRSCGRSCAPWFPLCDRCAGIAARS